LKKKPEGWNIHKMDLGNTKLHRNDDLGNHCLHCEYGAMDPYIASWKEEQDAV